MIRHLLMESNISAIMMLKWSWGWAEYAEHAEYAEYAKPQLTSGPLVPLAMFFKLLCHTFYESLVIPYISSWLRSVFVPHCQIWLVCPWGQWHQKELFIDDFQPNLFARIEPVRIWPCRIFSSSCHCSPPEGGFSFGARWVDSNIQILQKTAFWLVKSRLALGSPGCLFVRVSPCRKWPNTLENGCWLPPIISSIHSETLFHTRQDE